MKTKTFDCVEMKRNGADALRQQLAGMTLAEEIEFWKNRSDSFDKEQDLWNSKADDSHGKTASSPR